jgi:hypothetical protein
MISGARDVKPWERWSVVEAGRSLKSKVIQRKSVDPKSGQKLKKPGFIHRTGDCNCAPRPSPAPEPQRPSLDAQETAEPETQEAVIPETQKPDQSEEKLDQPQTTPDPSPNPQTDSSTQPPLLRLPTELIQHIASLISHEWIASLVITCKTLHHILGTASLQHTCKNNHQLDVVEGNPWQVRHAFLNALVRDYKDKYEYCGVCNSLHTALPKPTEFVPAEIPAKCTHNRGVLWRLPAYAYYGETRPLWVKHGGKGYVMIMQHLSDVFAKTDDGARRGQIDEFTANLAFKDTHRGIKETASVRADWIARNIVLRTEHRFSAMRKGEQMDLMDLLDMRIKVCPHQVTGDEREEKIGFWDTWVRRRMPRKQVDTYIQQYLFGRRAHRPGLLLSYALLHAWPQERLKAPPGPSWRKANQRAAHSPRFKRPTIIQEQNQLSFSLGEDRRKPSDLYHCRSCATKFRCIWDTATNELVLTVFQCFGDSTAALGFGPFAWHKFLRGDYNNEYKVSDTPWIVQFRVDPCPGDEEPDEVRREERPEQAKRRMPYTGGRCFGDCFNE